MVPIYRKQEVLRLQAVPVCHAAWRDGRHLDTEPGVLG